VPRRHTQDETLNKILSWAFPGDKPYENVTSLGFSIYPVQGVATTIFELLVKFPALKKLNLTNLCIPVMNFSLPNFQNLEWLGLRNCGNLTKNELLQLSEKVCKTLHYLGLALTRLGKDHLRDLPGMFPALRTLDLSGCGQITDAILVEWYIKHDKSKWTKLRKLVLKGCVRITQEVVDSVRFKTRNQLLIDL